MWAIRLGSIGAAFLMLAAEDARGQTAPAAMPASKISAAVFAEKPGFSIPKLSPDAARVAAVEHNGIKTRLLVVSLTGKEAEPSYFDVGGLPIADIRWAGPDRLLVRSELVLQMLDLTLQITRMTVVDLKTKTQHDLDPTNKIPVMGEVLHIDPKGEWLLLSAPKAMGETPLVRRIDLGSGASEMVEKARPNVWSWFADSAGVVRAGIAYDNDRWTMWYRDRPGTPLAKVRSPRFEESAGSVDSVYFSTGDNSGAILTNARTGRFAAYRFDFRTGQIGEVIYEHPSVDVTAILLDQTARSVAGVSYEDERARVAWFDPAMQAVQKRLDKTFPDLDSVVVDSSADGKHLLVWSGGASDPGTYYTFDVAARRLEALVKPYHKLSEARLSKVAPIRYTARDGLAIPGYLTLPQGRGGQEPAAHRSAAWRPVRARRLALRSLCAVLRQPRLRGVAAQFSRIHRIRKKLRRAGLWPVGPQDAGRCRRRRRLAGRAGHHRSEARVHLRCILWRLCRSVGSDPQSRTLSLRRKPRRGDRSARHAAPRPADVQCNALFQAMAAAR